MGIYYFVKHFLLKRVIIPLAFILSITGCSETMDPDLSNFGYDYYPMEVGDFRIYHTTSIRYNLNGTIDTVSYLVKEQAEELSKNVDGSDRLILGRYSADIGTNIWRKDSLWAVFIDPSKVVVSEANIDFIKLVFPLTKFSNWDGNATNSLEEEFYKVEDKGISFSYDILSDTLSYENTLTVVHKDLIDPAKLTEDDFRKEVFAVDIGLVYKLKIKINYCSTCGETGKIEDGFIFEQKLIAFGKE